MKAEQRGRFFVGVMATLWSFGAGAQEALPTIEVGAAAKPAAARAPRRASPRRDGVRAATGQPL